MNKQIVTIQLFREQFIRLLHLVYLGEWMVNAYKNGPQADPVGRVYAEIDQAILAQAGAMGLSDLVEYDDEFKQWFPTKVLSDEMYELTQLYDEESFWEELVHRLARRDLINTYGLGRVEALDNFVEIGYIVLN